MGVDVDEAAHGSTLAAGARWTPTRRGGTGAAGRDGLQLAECAGLEPADALAGDAELGADLFEGPRHLAVEAEASSSTWRMRSLSEASASFSSTLRRSSARTVSGCSAFSSSSMSPYMESPSPTGVSRLTGSSTRSKSSARA